MPGGGRLTVRSDFVQFGPAEARQRGVEPSWFLHRAVGDTGIGLSMVYGFAGQSGGPERRVRIAAIHVDFLEQRKRHAARKTRHHQDLGRALLVALFEALVLPRQPADAGGTISMTLPR